MKIKHLITSIFITLFWKGSAFAEQCSWEDCPASSMSDITAAFATEGYWLLADVVYQIGSTNLGLWAPLIYIMAYAAAGIMLALGQPPKNWIWLILGPVIYNWLVFTTPDNPVKGVGWRVVNQPVDQSIVWRKSEVGLLNTNQIANPSNKSAPGNTVELPLLFLWVDELVSSTVQHLAAWSGVFRKLENGGASTYTHDVPKVRSDTLSGNGDESMAWIVLSNSKWPMLESITQAKLTNHNTREAFIAFLSSECGDIFFDGIDNAEYISASNAPGNDLPDSIFKGGDHKQIIDNLYEETVPAPSALRELLADEESAGGKDYFRNFIGEDAISREDVKKFKAVRCDDFFGLIGEAFRWEAGHIYNQVIRQVGAEYKIPKGEINYDFLYGWAVKTGKGEGTTVKLTEEDQEDFIINLILAHLIRNEFAFAPGQINKRWTQTEMNIEFAESYQKTIGSKTKFGEMYTWTKLMPYIQGVLLYFLSAAYPFACMLMVVPGWHKTLFTWIGFFAWAKSWDIGFAMIGQLEKSIWAMLSNSDNDAFANGRVHEMKKVSDLNLSCGDGDINLGCASPVVEDVNNPGFAELLELFDDGLLLSNNLDMDIHNSYYIYLMSALYFGVPVATGQLFLGARAGSASMVNNMASPAQQDGGRGTQTGFQSDNAAKYQANAATASQGAYGKSLRQSGFALRSLNSKNDGMSTKLSADKFGTQGNLRGMHGQAIEAWGKDQMEQVGVMLTAGQATWQSQMARGGSSAAPGYSGASGYNSGGGGNSGAGILDGLENQTNKTNPLENTGNNLNLGNNGGAPRGTAGGFGGGATGNGPGGAAGLSAWTVVGMGWNGLKKGFSGIGNAGIPTVQAAVNRENAVAVARAVGRNRVAQGEDAYQGFTAGAMSAGHSEDAQRSDALANHQAQEDQWNFMQDMTAGGFAGSVSIATGLSPGAISAPSQRSTSLMGMAGQGFLGRANKSAFGFSRMEPGSGYFGQIMDADSSVRALTGADRLGMKETDLGTAAALIPRQLATAVTNAAGSAGNFTHGTSHLERYNNPNAKNNAQIFGDGENITDEGIQRGSGGSFVEDKPSDSGTTNTSNGGGGNQQGGQL